MDNNIIYNLPKIIWTHWDNINTLSEQTKSIFKNNKKVLSDWKIIFLTNKTIFNYINKKEIPINYNKLTNTHKADWIRLALLKKYGGCWMDINIMINSPDIINSIYNESINVKSELSVFYHNGFVLKNDPMTFVENWFIMAPQNSEIIKLWYNEFNYAIEIGFINYKKNIFNKINVSNIYLKNDDDIYLTQHACIQMVLQKKLNRHPNMLLYNSEESMYKLHSDCNWYFIFIYYKLLFEDIKKYPCVKLRGSDRLIYTYSPYFSYIIFIIMMYIIIEIVIIKNQLYI